jgi:membrane protein DedA with SNARE-associated domain
MDQFANDVLAFIRVHPDMAALVIGLTAFAESFAFLGFLFPGFAILVAAGTLVRSGAIDPVSAVAAGFVGAVLGDAISYWLGLRFGHLLPKVWPFRRHPDALARGVRFFHQWGWPSIFIGRFFGPLRAFVPLAAGMCRMPVVPFYIANVLSAAVWAPALLFSGYMIGEIASNGWSIEQKALMAGGAIVVFAALIWLSRKLFKDSK